MRAAVWRTRCNELNVFFGRPARMYTMYILVYDDGRVGALTLLDLSAAFDTVDHSVLTNVMRKRFGVSGKALDWVEEYVRDRSQAVRVNCSESPVRY